MNEPRPPTKQENTYPCACPEGTCWKVTKPAIQYCRKEQPQPTDPKIGASLTSNLCAHEVVERSTNPDRIGQYFCDECEEYFELSPADETKATQRVRLRLAKDIYDDGADHHPPGYIAHKGDLVVVHSIQTAVVSHRGIGHGFIVHDGDLELSSAEETSVLRVDPGAAPFPPPMDIPNVYSTEKVTRDPET